MAGTKSNSRRRFRAARNGGLAIACVLLLVLALQDAAALPGPPADFPPDAIQTWQAWRTTMRQAQGAATRQQLKLINDFFNRHIRYVEDPVLWGQED